MPYIGKSPGVGLRTRYNYTATASQTSFSGADNSNVTLTYTDTNYTDVYLNGVLLKAVTDYTSTTGTSIVLASGAAADDILEVVVYDAFSVADTVSAVDGGTFASNVSFGADISSSTLGTSNFRAGVNAGNSIASGGNFNTVVGDEAGTAITTGDGNSFFGKGAGALTVGTSYNVGVGDDALGANVATGNTAVGSAAMASTTSGHSNVAMGLEAGRYLTTGDSSAFIGYKAGQGIDGTKLTGDFNVAVGFQAGLVLQGAANRNVLVGANSGDAITTGQYNTAVGHDALTSVAGADNNVGIGLSAGAAITSGAGNTACGTNSGYFVSTGSNNTFLGFQAGQGITGTRLTGADNTTVGKDAGLLLQGAAESNTLIGALAGDALTTGSLNTAVGKIALGSDTQGSRAVAIGRFALGTQNFTSATANYNVAIGYSAGGAISTAVQNVCIGGTAGDAINTGNLNTVIGYESGTAINSGTRNTCVGGLAGQNISTGDSNICIGLSAETSNNDSERQIVMGDSVTGAGNDHLTFGHGSTDSAINFGETSITAPSDERYKEDITTATAGLSFIKDLRPVTFKWKKEKDIPNTQKAYVEGSDKRVMNDYTNHGFIAQEVKTAIDAHSEIKDGFGMWAQDEADGRQRLGPSALIPMLVKAIQEQNALIEALTARVTALES